MQIQQTPQGTLFILEKAFDSRTKWLFAVAAVVFLGPVIQLVVVFFLYQDGYDGGLNWISLLVAVVSLAIALRFMASAGRRDTLMVMEQTIELSRQKGLMTTKQLFEKSQLHDLRYLEKPILSEHPLAGKTFDYLGFQTQQKLIGELYGDDRIAFDYNSRTVSFGRQLYSWDFEEIQHALTDTPVTNVPNDQTESVSIDTLKAAHRHSIYHEQEIKASNYCGCFYCQQSFLAGEIAEWTDDEFKSERTALCPRCGIDSVIGDLSGFPVTDANWLRQMHDYYF